MAGYQILAGVDHWKPSIETFQKNHTGSKTILEDIRTVSSATLLQMAGSSEIDVIIGGPPCQGFSVAGDMDPKDPRNSLFKEFVRMVSDIKPQWFVMENVTGLLVSKTSSGDDVSTIIQKEFENAGYRVQQRVLMAADYGVPQKRRRVRFMGTNGKSPIEFPFPTHSEEPKVTIDGTRLEKWVPVSKVLIEKDKVDKKYFHSQRMIDGFVQRKKKHVANGMGFGWQLSIWTSHHLLFPRGTGRMETMLW